MLGTRSVRKGWCRAMVGLCGVAFALTIVLTGVAVSLPSSPLLVQSTADFRESPPRSLSCTPDPDTIVFFFSTSCRFCVDMKTILTKALPIVGREQIRFVEVNVDHDQTLAEKYTVSGVPTLVRVGGKTGKVMDRMQGGGKSLNAVVDFMYASA